MLAAPDRLRPAARALLEEANNELLLSAASTWEIAIKVGIGKLDLAGPPERVIPQMIGATGVTALPILHSHTLRVSGLPHHHRDPFDRLLVSQAQLEGVPILTADPQLARYDIDSLAA